MRSLAKGDDTRSSILEQALELSAEVGLEGLTVGTLAKRVGMSKSGLYAHFESKEDMQRQVLDAAASYFVDAVVSPALKQPRGLPRVRALFERWIDWISSNERRGGCLFIGSATELDDRPGPVRDTLVGHLRDVTGTIARAAAIAIEEGHFRDDLDLDQFAFEVWGILLTHHHFERLMGNRDARKRASVAFAALVRRATPA
ncbi:TetR/AcrR family transcriptional regulator [Paraliomyxa miuraensis]|uniref:TetR/AcrR family transcriptional regulator n=1 Tax=Paraliomyxa miuraensis TaxID=376150 RepID=UPI00225737A7|nr:TetR/AcrR family transcriptional regulator [Paraliomyxa miuraensis]MCX4240417.1 TetR/AcrR family transcriptional regulator [Paraliomyxa miuraensis]